MTREEAINVLDKALYSGERVREAVDMAIEALERDITECHECIYWKRPDPCRYWENQVPVCIKDGRKFTSENDFCSFGKREKLL